MAEKRDYGPGAEPIYCDCHGNQVMAVLREGRLTITDRRNGKIHFAIVDLTDRKNGAIKSVME